MSLSACARGQYTSSIIDGNVDRDFIATRARASVEGGVDAVGVTVMGGPQMPYGHCGVEGDPRSVARDSHHLGRPFSDHLRRKPALSAPYVDYVIRGQGEETLSESAGCDLSRRRRTDSAQSPA